MDLACHLMLYFNGHPVGTPCLSREPHGPPMSGRLDEKFQGMSPSASSLWIPHHMVIPKEVMESPGYYHGSRGDFMGTSWQVDLKLTASSYAAIMGNL